MILDTILKDYELVEGEIIPELDITVHYDFIPGYAATITDPGEPDSCEIIKVYAWTNVSEHKRVDITEDIVNSVYYDNLIAEALEDFTDTCNDF